MTLWLAACSLLDQRKFEPMRAKLPKNPGHLTTKSGQKIEIIIRKTRKPAPGTGSIYFWQDSQTVYRNNFGYVDKKKKVGWLDDNSVFEWGSVTKLTVWVSVMQLWEEENWPKNRHQNVCPRIFSKASSNLTNPLPCLTSLNHQAGFIDSVDLAKNEGRA